MNSSNYVAPNARLNNDNYKTWLAEMCTILGASDLLPRCSEMNTSRTSATMHNGGVSASDFGWLNARL